MANYEYVIKSIKVGNDIFSFLYVYEDGNEIWNSEDDSTVKGSEDGIANINDVKNDAINDLSKQGRYTGIKDMVQVDSPTKSETFTPEDVKKLSPPPPVQSPMSKTKGINIESTSVINQSCIDKIQKKQKRNKKEIKDATPDVSVSEELEKSKLSELNIPKSQVSESTDLSNTSMKDVIDTSKVDLANDDLSKIKTTDLNMNYLIGLGFSVLAIIGIVKLIKKKIKEIDKKTKEKNKTINTKSLNVHTDSNNTGSNSLNESSNTLDESVNGINTNSSNPTIQDNYIGNNGNNKRKVNNSNFSIDKRNRTDILNSSKAVTTTKNKMRYKNNPNFGKYFS